MRSLPRTPGCAACCLLRRAVPAGHDTSHGVWLRGRLVPVLGNCGSAGGSSGGRRETSGTSKFCGAGAFCQHLS